MQRGIIDAPAISTTSNLDLELNVRGRAGADSITGAGQVVYGVKPRWEGSARFHRLRPDDILSWRAFLSRLRGRVNVMRMPLRDPLRPTNSEVGLPSGTILPTPFSDGSYFSDGAGFAYVPSAPLSAAVAVGAVALSYNGTAIGDALRPGHFFSVDDWLYRVTRITGTGASTSIEFEPPARAAMAAGSAIRLDARALWVLPSDMAGAAQMDASKYTFVDLPLLEHVNR